MNESLSHLFSSAQLYESFPGVMKHLPGPHNKMFSQFNTVQDFISQEVKSHKKDVDRSDPRDYIDAFIIEMENVCSTTSLTLCSRFGTFSSNSLLCLFSAFLNSTESLIWASLRPIWL